MMSGKRKKKKSGWAYWRKRLRKRTRTARHAIIYALGRLAAGGLNLLPIDTAVRLGGRLGRLAFWAMPHLRHLTRRNLVLIYGDRLSAAERERLARRVFDNAGRGLAELLTFHRWDQARVMRRISYEGERTLPELQADGRPVMVIGAHFGAWEFAAAYAHLIWGSQMVAVVRDLNNPLMDRWLSTWRGKYGLETLHRGQAGIGLFRKVKEGRALCMLVDQFIEGPGVDLPFLGRPAHTFLGPAIVAQRLNAKLFVVQIIRQKDGLHFVMRLDEVALPPMEGLEPEEQVVSIARTMNDALSEAIASDPGQWMWFHDRWRPAKKKHRNPLPEASAQIIK